MWTWISSALEAVLSTLQALANLIIGLGEATVVLVTQAGTILGLLVQILWQMANIVGSLVAGLVATLQSVSQPAYSWGPAQVGADKLASALGLEPIGWALAGMVWLIIAISIIKVVARRG